MEVYIEVRVVLPQFTIKKNSSAVKVKTASMNEAEEDEIRDCYYDHIGGGELYLGE